MWDICKHEDFKLPIEERDYPYRSVLEESSLDPEFMTMLPLSALIVLLGLLQNSAAVVHAALYRNKFEQSAVQTGLYT